MFFGVSKPLASLAPSSQWRTLILVSLAKRGAHALSFPGVVPVHLLKTEISKSVYLI